MIIPDKPAECESCSAPPHRFINKMWLCIDHANAEERILAEQNLPKKCSVCGSVVNTSFRLGNWYCVECGANENRYRGEIMGSVIDMARKIDYSVQIRTDIFNAETVAIADIKKAIFEQTDLDIEGKKESFAAALAERIQHYKKVIFESNEAAVRAANQERINQQELNSIANQLRKEVRDKYITDPNYKPKAVEIKTVKPKQVRQSKFNPNEVKTYAAELGIGEATLQMFAVAKGLTIEMAANQLRKNIKETKSISE